MTSELPQLIGSFEVVRYGSGVALGFTIHRGGHVLLHCRGFVDPAYRERSIQVLLRGLRGEPPILTTHREVTAATKAVLRSMGAIPWVETKKEAA